MQGLVHYSDDSDTSPGPSNQAGPSRLRDQPVLDSPSTLSKLKNRPPIGIVITPKSPKRRRLSPKPNESSAKGKSKSHKSSKEALPENLTHTAESDISKSELSVQIPSKWGGEYEGLIQDEIIRIVTTPDEIEGLHNWGIPDEVNPGECSEVSKNKVEHFLKLKYENGEHINTRLLSSSAFANPHIYSKLVEFVSIDERSTNFPSSGWLTRRNLESLIPKYGPATLATQQKAKEEAVKASQAVGQRREIKFAPPKYKDNKRDKNGHSGYERDKHNHRDRHRDRERERDRERDRERKRHRG
ncbi:uncharacterized protein I206_107300 [Kwoniella pini CBS 10737]|uniref:Uncharacterized protein n=1 Tax=Kwoniella pini CBS 10737 TaxID=1296096 RepID=A0A1B9HYL5_9TREE|nr:uncharacterized protein I206_05156 [Kwoniella pini CBS 10737]OCF48379.1 hypothetical protein I206_05156 [Kwoniella pini CBS 10737]